MTFGFGMGQFDVGLHARKDRGQAWGCAGHRPSEASPLGNGPPLWLQGYTERIADGAFEETADQVLGRLITGL